MLTGFRIIKTKHARKAFDGDGAFRFGGRWNSRGTRIVYTSGSLALATLEMLVHFDDDEILSAYSYIAAEIPPKLILPLEKFRALPKNWNASPAPSAARKIGDDWARENASAVLEVPSAIVPVEKNYLLNPLHRDFEKIQFGRAKKFVFDKRFK